MRSRHISELHAAADLVREGKEEGLAQLASLLEASEEDERDYYVEVLGESVIMGWTANGKPISGLKPLADVFSDPADISDNDQDQS